MKVYLELEVNEDDLFITNNGIMPIKDIKDEYLTIGKYQFKFVKVTIRLNLVGLVSISNVALGRVKSIIALVMQIANTIGIIIIWRV